MRLRTRLIVQGAIIPTVLLCLALVVAGIVFDRSLHQQIDDALLAQSGVEAVSMFDRADAPHLHMGSSPMDTRVRELAPVAALYGPDGARITLYPVGAEAPETLAHHKLSLEPALSTEPDPSTGGRDRRRVLEVRVDAPDGTPYALWLAGSLDRHDRAVWAFWRVSSLSVTLSLVALLALQIRNASVLHRRLARLQAHMERLRAGELSARPEPDPTEDVIGELRGAIAMATERLERASEAQDRLVANAAHELRTPLTAIRTRVDVVRRRPRETAELEAALDDVRQEVVRLSELATQLLDLAAVRGGDADPSAHADLANVVEAAVDQARMLVEARDVSIVLRMPDSGEGEGRGPSLWVRGDAVRLRQAVDNLLSNAGKFAPPGTIIEVVVVPMSSDRVRLEVTDAGPGLGDTSAEELFEPFARGARSPDGTGLGLAIVRDVVTTAGGTVYVEARPPGVAGTRFVVELLSHPPARRR